MDMLWLDCAYDLAREYQYEDFDFHKTDFHSTKLNLCNGGAILLNR